MKAMIFAAGLGTRLRPLTNDRPKALVEVGGVTMLERVIMHLREAGITDITVNVHHFGQQIIDFLEARHNFGLTIHISDERDCLLDTGGGILHARQWLDGDEPFVVHNADILTDLDLRAMMERHTHSGADATILVKKRDTQRYLLFDQDHRLQGWTNKKTGELRPQSLTRERALTLNELAFGGVHVISPSIFKELEPYGRQQAKFSIIPFYVDHCHTLHIQGYEPASQYRWLDVGKPETLAQAEALFSHS